jgi:hypothetical protein
MTRAMEGAMPTKNLPGKSAPRVESNHRAREARLQVEQFERLLVKAPCGKGFPARPAVSSTWLQHIPQQAQR